MSKDQLPVLLMVWPMMMPLDLLLYMEDMLMKMHRRNFGNLKTEFGMTTDKNGPARFHEAISYDPEKGRILMFGGFNEQERTNELWEYSNKKWSIIDSNKRENPDPRAEHRSVFIPGRGLFVFGGVIGTDPNTRNRGNDTWLYNGNSWLKMN